MIGRQFSVITDHKPLETLRIKARVDEYLGDQVYYLSQYNFTIKYACGKDNIEADSLSKNPVLESFDNDEDVLKVVNLVTLKEVVEDQRQNENVIANTGHMLKKR